MAEVRRQNYSDGFFSSQELSSDPNENHEKNAPIEVSSDSHVEKVDDIEEANDS